MEQITQARFDSGGACGISAQACLARNYEVTILIVDDTDIARDYTVSILKREGYTILLADNGVSALVESRKHDGPIDVLVTDYQMPFLSGADVARLLTGERANLHVLVMSASDRDELPLESGWRFLPKPFIAAELLDLVRSILDAGDPI